MNCSVFKNLLLGFDPKLFTSLQIKKFFLKNNKIKKIDSNLIDKIYENNLKSVKSFYSLSNNITGENYQKKIIKCVKFLKKK